MQSKGRVSLRITTQRKNAMASPTNRWIRKKNCFHSNSMANADTNQVKSNQIQPIFPSLSKAPSDLGYILRHSSFMRLLWLIFYKRRRPPLAALDWAACFGFDIEGNHRSLIFLFCSGTRLPGRKPQPRKTRNEGAKPRYVLGLPSVR